MEEYKAIFRCRLCGETHINGPSVMVGKTIDNIVGELVGLTKSEAHVCKSGDVGMLDFIGFKKVVTNDETN